MDRWWPQNQGELTNVPQEERSTVWPAGMVAASLGGPHPTSHQVLQHTKVWLPVSQKCRTSVELLRVKYTPGWVTWTGSRTRCHKKGQHVRIVAAGRDIRDCLIMNDFFKAKRKEGPQRLHGISMSASELRLNPSPLAPLLNLCIEPQWNGPLS